MIAQNIRTIRVQIASARRWYFAVRLDKLQNQDEKDARILPHQSRPIKLTQLMHNHLDNWNNVAFDPAGPIIVFFGTAYNETRRRIKKGCP